MRLFRLAKIARVAFRFGLDQALLDQASVTTIGKWVRHLTPTRHFDDSGAVRMRLALESLGPIFVKFGQMLSTRRDLLPAEVAEELSKLQDRVSPFPEEQAIARLEAEYGKPVDEVFSEFNRTPEASASVAQVHFGRLHDGTEVAIKILRPNIEHVIDNDLALLDTAAVLIEKLWGASRRLKPREVVGEFSKHLRDELDLIREASNASLLRRNFKDSPLLAVPEIHWDYCGNNVMVMQRMRGIPISQIAFLRQQGVDMVALSRSGVEIFFTQVFRDGFFHADMHPGNILVSIDPEHLGQYIALDFGIMGTLNERSKQYLAQNFLGFFQRDYRRVAEAHIEAGWAPPGTRVDEFESAIRAVCEPIFDRPLKDISLGKTLLRLFQASRRFNIEIQPQLVMLQKTLLNIEGLGRELNPELDLWKTAKPFLERWMNEQVGWRAFVRHVKHEAPTWAAALPQLPRLVHQALDNTARDQAMQMQLQQMQQKQKNLVRTIIALSAVFLGFVVFYLARG